MKRYDPNNTVIETCSKLYTNQLFCSNSAIFTEDETTKLSHSFSSYKVEQRSVRPQNSVSAMHCGVKSCRYKPM